MRAPSKASRRRHTLTLTDRGPQHRHRWLASCSCGWAGIPLNLQRSAIEAFDHHAPKPRGRRPDTSWPTPKALTPVDRLPSALVIDLRDGRPTAYDDGVGGRADPTQEDPMADFAPTPEQEQALALFATGNNLVIEAGAGTGKTATLRLLAESTPRQGAYLAFNKAIVAEAGAKMPGNVTCSTAHSLAFRAVGKRYSHRLNGPRMKAAEQARRLGIDPLVITTPFGSKRLAAGFLAGVVNRAVGRFCQTADEAINERHFPYLDGIDLPTPDGRKGWAANREVAMHLLPAARRAWADLSSIDGALRFGHDHYLKLWQLEGPRIAADFILFDEAQDANPVMLAIVAAQGHAQRVYVGDSQQQIYSFTGAINALASIDGAGRTFLTQSFRFGPDIAGQANRVLARLSAELVIKGTPTIASVVGPVAEPDVVLCRTNATTVSKALDALDAGRKPHIVGGAAEVVAFAKGALSLMDEGWTSHPELACFDSWEDVRDYVANDQQGGELRLLVNLVDKFTAPTIIEALGRMTPEATADVVLSTAHKAKGREWDTVALASDFPDGTAPDGSPREPEDEELRLVYVAITRARRELDLGVAVGKLLDDEPDDTDEPGDVASDLAGVPVPQEPATDDVERDSLGRRPCPSCGRYDVYRAATDLIGAHDCAGSPTAHAARLRMD